ncbi:hypothetical protein VP01_1663g2 [Puccinia sorghi]|uniref:Uncharacterized protein n=1 Tax=Puccinia sorghi TaxID=27349 RepID=A0A0L6VGT5_9BASI|nr:hypothetical protein VP01_1663g2 [Puccinia sorghi]
MRLIISLLEVLVKHKVKLLPQYSDPMIINHHSIRKTNWLAGCNEMSVYLLRVKITDIQNSRKLSLNILWRIPSWKVSIKINKQRKEKPNQNQTKCFSKKNKLKTYSINGPLIPGLRSKICSYRGRSGFLWLPPSTYCNISVDPLRQKVDFVSCSPWKHVLPCSTTQDFEKLMEILQTTIELCYSVRIYFLLLFFASGINVLGVCVTVGMRLWKLLLWDFGVGHICCGYEKTVVKNVRLQLKCHFDSTTSQSQPSSKPHSYSSLLSFYILYLLSFFLSYLSSLFLLLFTFLSFLFLSSSFIYYLVLRFLFCFVFLSFLTFMFNIVINDQSNSFKKRTCGQPGNRRVFLAACGEFFKM